MYFFILSKISLVKSKFSKHVEKYKDQITETKYADYLELACAGVFHICFIFWLYLHIFKTKSVLSVSGIYQPCLYLPFSYPMLWGS
jgi:hypothetical protein